MKPLEMWGGVECSLNRVGDSYYNQCDMNGHKHRLSDLQLFHNLGIKNLRYPCLWEEVAPKSLDHCNWAYLDERLNELKRLGQDFIAGLLHHGSGPMYTSLIDPDFPEKFATYARHFATRYPWVTDYTPINEINTTARFSLLYGHWYPHLKDNLMYYKSLLLQCKATVLAMREIRRVNPKARFIQTDDLGKYQSTPELAYQRDFENERRWLTWDLLCGKVNVFHPLYEKILTAGISSTELMWLEDNPFPPDIIGINHYPLSNRYLDHRTELFPEGSHGENERENYADVRAVDTDLVDPVHPEMILREAWERYGISLAVTECHIGGQRESQMRWLDNMWKTCIKLREEGVKIEAVTAWGLLGTYDCTKKDYFYESGVFDLRSPSKKPQPTALAKMVEDLAKSGRYHSPLLGPAGTWETILITGASGTLGEAFARICGERNINYELLDREQMDITDFHSIMHAIEKYRPWAIINAAGDEVEGAVNLAKACKAAGPRLISFSSDLVFDDNSEHAYLASQHVSPLNTYGKSKAECEEKVLSIYPDSLIIRTSSFFGPWHEHNFITKTLRELRRNAEVSAPNDMIVSPTYVPDLVNESLDLLIDGEKGIVHLTNVGEVSWEQFALLAVKAADTGASDEKVLHRAPDSY